MKDRLEVDVSAPASSFRSAPIPRRPSVSLADENGVPDFALPGGGPFWAQGFHAGQIGWFRATTIKLRKAFPRIHVRFLADVDGNTHHHALPELDAYVHAGMIKPRDW